MRAIRAALTATPRLTALAALLLLLLVVTATRFHLLGAQSFWNDEGISYVQSTRAIPDIIANAARDIHPPLYYLLLAGWRLLVGESEFALRALSSLLSVMSIAVTYALGRRLYGHLAGVAAALFLSLNTFSIYYAQELRMYSLLALLAGLSMWAFASFMLASRRNNNQYPARFLVALALLNTAGLYTQYSYPLVIVAQVGLAAWLLILDGARSRRIPAWLPGYAAANIATLILFAPWLQIAWSQVTAQPNISQPLSFAEAVSLVMGTFTFGITYPFSLPSPSTWFFLLFGLLVLQDRREHLGWRIAVPAVWVLVSVGAFISLGLTERYMRFLLPAHLGFMVLLGRGAALLWHIIPRHRPLRAVPRLAAVVGTVAFIVAQWSGLHPLYHHPDYQRTDYRTIANILTASQRPGDAIILNAPNQEEVFRYYYHASAPVFPLPRGLGGDDAATLAAVRDIIATHQRVSVLFWGEAERDPTRVVETTLDGEAFEAGNDQWFGDVRLARYVTPLQLPAPTPSGADFGALIVLENFALSSTTLNPGDVLQLQLVWTARTTPERRYKVFVQLLNAAGILAAQRDSEPGGGSLPTLAWLPDTSIVDNHGLYIPDDLPEGDYQLIIGLYDSDNPAARLPVGAGDFLLLETITILPPSN